MLGNTVLEPADGQAESREPDEREPGRSGREIERQRRALLAAIREELLAQAPLFDDPNAYGAGVLDTLEALTAQLGDTTIRGAEPEGSSR